MMDYLEFELTIRRDPDGHVVEARSPAGEASGRFGLAWDQGFREKLAAARRRAPDAATAREVGAQLFQALLPPAVLGRFRESLGISRSQHARLGINLRCDVPDLAGLPWELLYDPDEGKFLAASAETPLTRYVALPIKPRELSVEPPLRLLVASASPADYPPLDVEGEIARIQAVLKPLQQNHQLEVRVLQYATPATLQEALEWGPHILHVVSHGRRGPTGGVLVLQDAYGDAVDLPAADLAARLAETGVQCVVLVACHTGAGADGQGELEGIGPVLVRAGVAAVVTLQQELPDKAALEFSDAFYRALAAGQPVGVAVSMARRHMRAVGGQESGDWSVPILHTRDPAGCLVRTLASPGRAETPAAATRRRSAGLTPKPILAGLAMLAGLVVAGVGLARGHGWAAVLGLDAVVAAVLVANPARLREHLHGFERPGRRPLTAAAGWLALALVALLALGYAAVPAVMSPASLSAPPPEATDGPALGQVLFGPDLGRCRIATTAERFPANTTSVAALFAYRRFEAPGGRLAWQLLRDGHSVDQGGLDLAPGGNGELCLPLSSRTQPLRDGNYELKLDEGGGNGAPLQSAFFTVGSPPVRGRFGPLAFATAVDDQGAPIEPTDTFLASIEWLYMVTRVENLPAGATFGWRWFHQGRVIARYDTDNRDTITLDEQYWLRRRPGGQLPTGQIDVIFIIDSSVAQRGHFTVTPAGPAPTPTATPAGSAAAAATPTPRAATATTAPAPRPTATATPRAAVGPAPSPLAGSPVAGAASPSPLASPRPPLPVASPSPAPGPGVTRFSPIVFAEGVDADKMPVRANAVFASGINRVYAIYDWEGVPPGTVVKRLFRYNGEISVQDETPWEPPASGRSYNFTFNQNAPLPDGNYEFQLYVGSHTSPDQWGFFTIGTPPDRGRLLDLQFAAAVNDDATPRSPTNRFPAGTRNVYVTFRGDGVADLTPVGDRIRLDGDGESSLDATWDTSTAGPNGRRTIRLHNGDQPLPTGLREVTLILNGQAVASGSFSVGEVVPIPADWSGTWTTSYGQLLLFQAGNRVAGSYGGGQWRLGRLTGTIAGDHLTGTWLQAPTYAPPSDAGVFDLTLARDGGSFTGEWHIDTPPGARGAWTGQRPP